ncbi:hypothetical protein [Dongia rigui]|uniref:Uncharacterized protein n=1 Tax=Dongia rigui TaxID=940149 RepID=A0ABU5DXR5_9PROT|nr:hypothetical protein [Dongia rigui]MDY0871503.1 hypothetical protein [Dongia rigui]
MRQLCRNATVVAFASMSLAILAGCQGSKPQPLAQSAGATAPQLPPSNYEFVAPGTVIVWRDLNSGDVFEEHVKQPKGRMMESTIGARRSYAYVPDPWADNENTRAADIEPLFPLEVGKQVTFKRNPPAGMATDVVKVVRTETLQLAMGPVDTYVIETRSEIPSDNWVGEATFWYAPSLKWQVQMTIKDNKGDDRRRQVVEIKAP